MKVNLEVKVYRTRQTALELGYASQYVYASANHAKDQSSTVV